MFEHIGQFVGLAAVVGRHVLQDGGRPHVELDDLGDVAVNRLVVGDAGARRVDDGDAARAVDVEDAGHAEHRIRPEHERIEEVVVDAAVEDVDPAQAERRLHVQAAVEHHEILALDQIDAHLVGEERVLEIGAVEDAGRQHRDGRLAFEAALRDRFERAQQIFWIVVDGRDAVQREQVGEHVHHRFPVLQHVGDAGRRAGVVLQDVDLVLARADEVDADDVAVDAERRLDADHLGHEGAVLDDQLLGDALGLQDLLAVVDVVHEHVERAHALLDAGAQTPPLGARDDARHDVERDQALGRFVLAVDVEGDTGAPEQALGFPLLLLQILDALAVEPLLGGGIGLANARAPAVHLVECRRQRTPPRAVIGVPVPPRRRRPAAPCNQPRAAPSHPAWAPRLRLTKGQITP